MEYRIKQLRKERGLSQEALARASCVSRTTISHLETHAERATSILTLFKLAQALGVGVDRLFQRESIS